MSACGGLGRISQASRSQLPRHDHANSRGCSASGIRAKEAHAAEPAICSRKNREGRRSKAPDGLQDLQRSRLRGLHRGGDGVEGGADLRAEATGSGLHEAPRGGAAEVYARVSAEFPRRFRARWLPPLGFENTYAIAMRRSSAI